MTSTADIRYPIGRFEPSLPATGDVRREALEALAELPQRIRAAVADLTDAQLDAPYRPGGWSVRQLVHHVADSHMNGYIRLKLALTEDTPIIKPYDQEAWASLPDSRMPLSVSLALLDGVQARWVQLYRALSEEQLARAFYHPEMEKPVTLDEQLQTYAWHSRHHVAHITALRRREGW